MSSGPRMLFGLQRCGRALKGFCRAVFGLVRHRLGRAFPGFTRSVSGLPRPRRSGFAAFGLERSCCGFTLAELLIALAILGVIATFTIPKVLQGQQNGKYKAIGKETAAMISEVVQNARLAGTLNANTSVNSLSQYINYVRRDTTSTLNRIEGWSDADCSNAVWWCLRLHNGAVLIYGDSTHFSGSATTNAIYYYLDPDGVLNGPAGSSVLFWVYYDGAVRTQGTARPGTVYSAGNIEPDPSKDPPWFGWD